MLGLRYTYHVNGNRSHGFELPADMLSGYLVIAADFTITQEEMENLVSKGVACICIDHHKCQDEFIDIKGVNAEGIVINNQYPFEPVEDRYLSGAGVVYELFVSLFQEFKSEDRASMVGITLLSDIRAIENKKAHRYLAKTYNNAEEYMRYLVDETMRSDFGFGVPRMDRDFIDFTFSPTINAMLRFNKVDEAIDLIFGKGMQKDVDYRKKQQELITVVESDVEILDMQNTTILAVDATKYDEDITNFIGLICSKYKNNGKSTLIFAHREGKILRASFRGRYDDLNYLNEFRLLGIDANGHEPAFGIKNFFPKPSLWQEIDKMIGGIELNHVDTRTVIDTSNLSMMVTSRGSKLAYENCFVRDMYRAYFRYTGRNIKELRHTYKMSEFTDKDYLSRRKPDKTVKGVNYKYDLDKDGNKVTKYIEYVIDGRTVKAFKDVTGELLILPILEKGYMQLYLM